MKHDIGERYNWQQESPSLQATAILASIRGELSNLEEGTSSSKVVLRQCNSLLEDLNNLCMLYMPRDWKS